MDGFIHHTDLHLWQALIKMTNSELQVVKNVLGLMTMGQLRALTDEYARNELLNIEPENTHHNANDISQEALMIVHKFVTS